jgi:hypothetical protein
MEAIEQALNDLGAGISQQLRTDIVSKSVTKYGPVNASGKLAKSIRYDVTPTNLKVYALNYFYYVENGRKGGKRPPFDKTSTKFGNKTRGKNKGQPRGDYPTLSEWLENKPSAKQRFGYDSKTQAQKSGLIYAIAKKIAESGTVAFQQGGTKLLEDVTTKERIDMVRQQLALTMQNQLIRTAFSNVIIK